MSNLQTIMRELEARDQRERNAGLPSAQRMRALVPDAGKFIAIVIRACRYRRILEIGTSYGYSTLWLASAAQAVGGHVDTIELSAERFAGAQVHFARAGVSEVVTQHQGDAKQWLTQMDGEYDFVFIDAEKDDYEDYLDLAKNRVARGGMLMADNVLSHADQLGHYIAKAQHTAGLFSVTVPVGRGEEMSLRVDEGLAPEVVATLAEVEVAARRQSNAASITREAGKLLHILARAMNVQSVIALGAATSAAGVWLAAAMQQTGGRVLGIASERDAIKTANAHFAKARLAPYISLAAGSPRDVLPTLNSTFDFAFLDGTNPADAEALWSMLKPGALVVANTNGEASDAYAKTMRARADVLSVSLQVGKGMELTIKL